MSERRATYLPCADPAPDGAVLGAARAFSYLGIGLTVEAFRLYIADYHFGSIPPDQIVLHHTSIPDASWAPAAKSIATWWDRDEDNLSLTAIKNKRNRQLDAIRDYYRDTLHWPSGPHLFIDDRWVWLFTPMYDVGTHAAEGNSYHDAAGQLHYSIGIEVIGHYAHTVWPPAVADTVRGAVQALRDHLDTFQIVYHAAPLHTPAAHEGSIAAHRDYNKPACPGDAITPDYFIRTLAIDPLQTHRIAGPAGASYTCSAQAHTLYTTRGGFDLLGYALADETRDGSDTYLRLERAVIKTSAQYGAELALLSEARARGWLS